MLKGFIAAAFAVICSCSAHAADYKLEFTAKRFYEFGPGPSAPYDSLSGSFSFSSVSADPSSLETWLKDVDLTIGAHKYKRSELGFYVVDSYVLIGANFIAPNSVGGGIDDFYIVFKDGRADSPFTMAYSVAGVPNAFTSSDIDIGPQPMAAVPEPEIYAMVFAGLGLVGFTARRRSSTV